MNDQGMQGQAPAVHRQMPELGDEPLMLRIIGASTEIDEAKRIAIVGGAKPSPRLERHRVFMRLGSESIVAVTSIVGDGRDGFSVQTIAWMCDIDMERKGFTITHKDPLCIAETMAMAIANLEGNALQVLAEIKRRRAGGES